MKKSLLITFVIWVATGAAMYHFYHGRFTPPGDWVGALIGSFLTMLGIGSWRNISYASRDRRLIRSAAKGTLFQDGEMTAAVGTMRVTGEPLTAPFSKRPAAILDYEIYSLRTVRRNDSTQTEKSVICSGMWMASCAVRTPIGDVKLIGFPELKYFEKTTLDDDQAYANAAEFIANTAFEDMSGMQVRKMFSEIASAVNDDDGVLRKNWRMEEHIDLEGNRLDEQCALVDEPVCAVGRFSQLKNALVQSFGAGDMVRLYRGTPEQIAKKIGSGMFGYFFFGVVLIGLGLGGSYGILTARENGSGLQRERRSGIESAINDKDAVALQKLLEKPYDIDKPNPFGETLLMRAQTPDVQKVLLVKGAALDIQDEKGKTALMRAAQSDRSELVEPLLRAGANKDIKDKLGFTAIMLARWADATGTEELLRRAGAADFRVDARNGTAIAADSSSRSLAAARAFLEGVYTADLKTLSEVLPDRSISSLEGSDFAYWQASRPRKTVFVDGYENREFATLRLRGTSGSGEDGVWEYQMFYDGKFWKLLSDRPVTPP